MTSPWREIQATKPVTLPTCAWNVLSTV
jgi:hypothetical protein